MAPAGRVYGVPLKETRLGARVDKYLGGLSKRGNFSGSVLIERHNRTVLAKGYGFADWKNRVHNTAETRFRLASVTKQFTAMAILELQERGELSVHDFMCNYVPACPEAWQQITIHELLTHTSGIPDLFSNDVPGFEPQTPYTPEQVIALVRDLPLESVPGTEFNYSNTGYVILGYIIAKVSREPYGTFLGDNVFRPLGMTNSGVSQDALTVPNLAIGYTDLRDIRAPVWDETTAYSAAGAYSTVGDLNIWDQSLETQKLVSQKSLDAMFSVYYPPQASVGYGYGWYIVNLPGHRIMWHDGEYPGVRTVNMWFPDDGVSIIVLSNETEDDFGDIVDHVVTLVVGNAMKVQKSRYTVTSATMPQSRLNRFR